MIETICISPSQQLLKVKAKGEVKQAKDIDNLKKKILTSLVKRSSIKKHCISSWKAQYFMIMTTFRIIFENIFFYILTRISAKI